MSPRQAVQSSPTDQPSTGQNDTGVVRAKTRLAEITRDLQSLAKRKLTRHETAARDHAAMLQLRCEMILRDPRSDSNDIVRVSNVARRAKDDFLTICGIDATRKRKAISMADIEREIANG